jgi:hypothetical protein
LHIFHTSILTTFKLTFTLLNSTSYLQYDTEIVYLENNLKGRDHVQTLEAISQDIIKTDQLNRQVNEEVSFKYKIKLSNFLI